VIFDSQEKYDGLKQFSVEMDDLLREVAKEQVPWLSKDAALMPMREAIESLTVPS
jgi:hypothetical protein